MLVFQIVTWSLLGAILLLAAGAIVLVLLPGAKVPVGYNLRNLAVRWRTTLLTALGFFLIVAVLVVMLAFVEGMRALSENSGPPGNVIVLRDGANDEIFSDIPIETELWKVWGLPEVVQENGQPLYSLEVYSLATQEFTAADGKKSYRFLQVRGVIDSARAGRVHGLRLREGAWFRDTGDEIVLGEGIAQMLGVRVGSRLSIRPGLDWKVVGIMQTRGSPFDSEIWAKLEDVGKYFGKDNEERKQRFYTSLVVQTRDRATAEAFAGAVKDRTSLEVSAIAEQKYYENMAQGTQLFMTAAFFVAAIMAIGGLIGLMTTMYAAVAQRAKDIGVLRILGFSRWRVLVSFLFESLVVALAGGLLGLGAGLLFNGVEQSGVISSGQGGGKTVVFQMVVTPFVIGAGVTFTLVMGVLGGLLPAYAATRLRPLEAMR